MRAIIDTNVIVDVLQKREPWFESGSKIFIAVANRQIAGCITAKQADDVHFFSRKQFKGQDNADEKTDKSFLACSACLKSSTLLPLTAGTRWGSAITITKTLS